MSFELDVRCVVFIYCRPIDEVNVVCSDAPGMANDEQVEQHVVCVRLGLSNKKKTGRRNDK